MESSSPPPAPPPEAAEPRRFTGVRAAALAAAEAAAAAPLSESRDIVKSATAAASPSTVPRRFVRQQVSRAKKSGKAFPFLRSSSRFPFEDCSLRLSEVARGEKRRGRWKRKQEEGERRGFEFANRPSRTPAAAFFLSLSLNPPTTPPHPQTTSLQLPSPFPQVPDEILKDHKLAEAIAALPTNYDFEIHKTIWRLRQLRARRVALQFPEGLLLFSLTLSDIISEFVPGIASVTVLGDVAYGACCVDDQGALACANADALVHYGHSCLVPVQASAIPTIYVFVHIGVDVDHLISTIGLNFYNDRGEENAERDAGEGETGGEGEGEGETRGEGGRRKKRNPIAIAGTVQFAPAVAAAAAAFAGNSLRPKPVVPQSRPLSPGEVLGCTAPRLDEESESEESEEEEEGGEAEKGEEGEGRGGRSPDPDPDDNGNKKKVASSPSPPSPPLSIDAILFVADGRFHMEALMIANPRVPAFRYDPYSRVLTRERFDHGGMRRARKGAIAAASLEKRWGLVLGTLGRQGSREVLSKLVGAARAAGKEVSVVLVSELSPAKLAALTRGRGGIGENDDGCSTPPFPPPPPPPPPRAWAQVACPRLSIDWGEGFGGLPVLTPYEAMVSLGAESGWWVEKKKKSRKPKSKEATLSSSGEGGNGCCGGGGGGCGSESKNCGSGESGKVSIDLEGDPERGHYPMDYYSSAGGSWAGTYHRGTAAPSASKVGAAARARAARSGVVGVGRVESAAAAAAAAAS